MARQSPGGLAARRAARQKYEEVAKSSPPGEGSRFKAVEAEAAAGGARNPAAVAAAAGRAKYGKARFQRMAAAGRRSK
jgi:hypothetical protein